MATGVLQEEVQQVSADARAIANETGVRRSITRVPLSCFQTERTCSSWAHGGGRPTRMMRQHCERFRPGGTGERRKMEYPHHDSSSIRRDATIGLLEEQAPPRRGILIYSRCEAQSMVPGPGLRSRIGTARGVSPEDRHTKRAHGSSKNPCGQCAPRYYGGLGRVLVTIAACSLW